MTFTIGSFPTRTDVLGELAEALEGDGRSGDSPLAAVAEALAGPNGRADWSWAGAALHRGLQAAEPRAASRDAGEPQERVKSAFKEEFAAKAADKKEFDAFMKQVYGDHYDTAMAEQFRQRALAGDFSWLPPVKFVDAATLHGANGAYNAQEGVVYINRDVAACDPAKAAQTYVEEAGHHLDAKLNTSDTQGDEGEMFRRILSGEQLSGDQIAAIRSDNDRGTIVVDGKRVEVEFWGLDDIGDAIGDVASSAVDTVKDVASDAVDAVGDAVDYAGNAARDVVYSVGDAVKEAGMGVIDGARMFMEGFVHDMIGGWMMNMLQGRFSDAFESLGNGLEKMVIQAPRRAMNGMIEGAGHMLKTVTYWLPEKMGGAFVRNVIDRGVDSVRSIANGMVDIARNTVRLPFEIVGGFTHDIGEALKHWARGDIGGGFERLGLAFVHPVERIAGSFVDDGMIAAQALGNVAGNITGTHEPSRGLNKPERELLKSIYGDSLNLEDIRVHKGNLSHELGIAPHTVGNDIYLPDDCFAADGSLNEKGRMTLVHEAFHVYQAQHGGNGYIHEALATQVEGIVKSGDRNTGYDWTVAMHAGKRFDEWNPEQQAEFFETLARAKYGTTDADGDGVADGDYDLDNDGQIDANELELAWRDKNGDGMADRNVAAVNLTNDEFQQLMATWTAAKDDRPDRTIV